MSKIGVFLADGFEEIEALTVVDICRRLGIDVDMVSIKEDKMVEGSHGIRVEADCLFTEVDFAKLDMIVLPGGLPGTTNLEAHKGLMERVNIFYSIGKYVAAICAAPTIFGHRGIVNGRKACCYPGMEEQLKGAEVMYDSVTVSDHVITSRGMGCAIDFALAIGAVFCEQEKVQALAKAIVYSK